MADTPRQTPIAASAPPVDAAGLGKALTQRMKPSPFSFGYAIVSVVGGTAPSGESVVTVTAGDPPYQVTYPFVRFAETPTALTVGDKVLLLWIGTNPVVVARLVP